jgi:hypothetical protein
MDCQDVGKSSSCPKHPITKNDKQRKQENLIVIFFITDFILSAIILNRDTLVLDWLRCTFFNFLNPFIIIESILNLNLILKQYFVALQR